MKPIPTDGFHGLQKVSFSTSKAQGALAKAHFCCGSKRGVWSLGAFPDLFLLVQTGLLLRCCVYLSPKIYISEVSAVNDLIFF